MSCFRKKTFVGISLLVLIGLLVSCSNNETQTSEVVFSGETEVLASESAVVIAEMPETEKTSIELVIEDANIQAESILEPSEILTPSIESENLGQEDSQGIDVNSPTPPVDLMLVLAPGIYADYSPEALANAEGDIILFFHATWCATCMAIEKKIIAGPLPDDLTILKVDYDTDTELKKKYSVLTQTTFVQVDYNGKLVHRWVGGKDVDDLESRLK